MYYHELLKLPVVIWVVNAMSWTPNPKMARFSSLYVTDNIGNSMILSENLTNARPVTITSFSSLYNALDSYNG